ncbi:capon-like protein isoform X6 [Uranotaenia lowii]|uniref:capon-like protein isoform X6 n=1 Tax=Uranotaenia lowii TaxID=190385 RepID=UPI00247A893D|nr:capon-like protein isoform X6 [Uranotaenia lowii]
MPSQPYDLVKDDQDSRVPLYPEQAFYGNGISFPARLIGWQTVTRPSSRTEIVQAMRRIRYECKVQNAKKRKITFIVSVDGVRVNMKRKKRKKKNHWNEPPELEILNHPIYRIFYVSHDSNDLKIFSYIARDGSSDVFRCCVFKTNKKSQAMRIVRTVGQAFEVCHKLSLQDSVEIADEPSEASLCDFSDQDKISDEENIKKDIISESDEAILPGKNNKTDMSSISNMYSSQPPSQENGNESTLKKTPLSASQEVVCLREQLDHQQLQTRQVVAQLMLVRDQLITETNARIEAQARTQQLLQQNRELLEHIASIGGYHEPDRPGLSSTAIGLAPQLSSTAKVARWFHQLQWTNQTQPLSRPESGFVSGDSRSEKNQKSEADITDSLTKDQRQNVDLCDEYLLIEGTSNLWSKLNVKKRKKLLSMKLGKVTTF